MSIYIDNQRLLTESDKQPQWNLLTGTSQVLKEAIISQGQSWPQFMLLNPVPFSGVLTASVYIENNSEQAICLRGDGSFINNSDSVLPHQAKTVYVTTPYNNNGGIYFSLQNANDHDTVAKKNLTFKYKELKLERGSVATPWMPAVADLMLKNQNGGVSSHLYTHLNKAYVTSYEMEVA